MAGNSTDSQQAKKPNVNSPKKFSKVKLLQILGLLSRKFNYETSEFESSRSLRLVSYLSVISTQMYCMKFLVSCFFPRNHISQLFIGSVFNYLTGQTKLLIGILVSIEQDNN